MGKICKRHGEKEAFDERKLYASIYHPAREAGYSEEEAEALAEEVVEQVRDWMDDHEDNVFTADEIQEKTKERLETQDEDVAFLYESHLDIN